MQEKIVSYKKFMFSRRTLVRFTDDRLVVLKGGKERLSIGRDEIRRICYGVKWISGISFTWGRAGVIKVSDGRRKIWSASLYSLYRIRIKEQFDAYSELIDGFYEFYFEQVIADLMTRINLGETVELSGTLLSQQHVCLHKNEQKTGWEDVNFSVFKTYCTLSLKSEPSLYKGYTYIDDWDALLAYAVIVKIMKSKGLLS